ncbi:germination protein, Ger(x)C family [Paenibacillus uliginis N3/975]|uniref:Germination protein, Ger(X)C family n=1 Tax=Paenibacillus uliginis N3/975 TaxID=1313296 RepID=A0A1X7HG50_9BACL|nr:Ger(x)C family spore germination protein [Paenibacillus uliginis]SMF85964.1 germination protein, Ger(x)C family [Paenibacillus uliginis N3/975]
MRLGIIIFAVCFMASLLSGCWDQQLLKDDRLIFIVGLDLTSDGKIQTTSAILDVSGSESGQKQYSEIHTVSGNTSRHTRDITDREVPGRLSASKIRVILFGEALARKGIYPYLDVLYRDPKSALNAKIAVVKGNAKDAINMKLTGTKLISEHFSKLIRSAENRTIVPAVNLQIICPSMLDSGDDFAVPYISKSETKPLIYGIALFSGDIMKGTLKSEDSLLYLLMKDKLAKTSSLTLKINQEGNREPEKYIAMNIQRLKRKMKVNVNGYRNINVTLDLNLKVTAIEYPKDHLNDRRVLGELNKKLSEELTRRAQAITKKMQQANFDGFGIGRRLMAYYPDTWKNLNWVEDYPKVEFDPKVTVEIVSHGIMN